MRSPRGLAVLGLLSLALGLLTGLRVPIFHPGPPLPWAKPGRLSQAGTAPRRALASSNLRPRDSNPSPANAAPRAGAPTRPGEEKFTWFAEWLDKYEKTPEAAKPQLEGEGIDLARRRRDEMLDMIQADPERALALAVTAAQRQRLPRSVRYLTEEHVRERGKLLVLAALPAAGEEGGMPAVLRQAELGGKTYQAYVYGSLRGEPTCEDTVLAGIHLEGMLALEDRIAPAAGPEVPLTTAASDWTEGIKTLLVLRVDFSDLAGEPLTESAATNLVRNVHAFYQEMSYGLAGFALVGEGSEVTPTFRMPETAAYYGRLDASRLRSAARAAAREAGYDLSNYDLDVICFGAVPGFRFAGLAYVGAAGAWLRNSFSTGVAAHELGHNFGLNHANFWDTAGQSVIGPGTSVEYGDTFDTMGSAGAGSKHFNARYKNLLNWLPSRDVLTATNSGTFRLGALDDPDGSGPRALKIAKNSRTNYWVEFRQRYTSNKWLMEGVGLRWSGTGNESTRLLDSTAGSVSGKDDAALLIGRTFSDTSAGIHITPLRKLGTEPETIEIAVQQGSFPQNQKPLILLEGETNSLPGTPLIFTASATDPDGDALAYQWDFGDRSFGSNSAEVTHGWSSVGEYVVRCMVTDLKGGVASDALVVRVGTPTTFRISGTVSLEGAPLEGVRVFVSSTQMTYSDSQGRYTLTGLVPGSFSVKAAAEGYAFTPLGFINPVRVGPSQSEVNFAAVDRAGQNTRALVAAGSLWRYLDNGSDAGSAWRELDFDDGTWSEGPAPLGYGEDAEKTVVSFGPNSSAKYITTYFRHAFPVDHPGALSLLTLGLRRDDGGIVYLNGREIFRSNLPSGIISSTTLASSTVGGTDERTFFQTDLDPSLLRSGTNVLGVEIHQASRTSSDIGFDLELLGVEAPRVLPPALAWEFSAGTLRVAWPEGPTDWILRSSSDLGAELTAWLPVGAPSQSVDGHRVMAIDTSASRQFFVLTPP